MFFFIVVVAFCRLQASILRIDQFPCLLQPFKAVSGWHQKCNFRNKIYSFFLWQIITSIKGAILFAFNRFSLFEMWPACVTIDTCKMICTFGNWRKTLENNSGHWNDIPIVIMREIGVDRVMFLIKLFHLMMELCAARRNSITSMFFNDSIWSAFLCWNHFDLEWNKPFNGASNRFQLIPAFSVALQFIGWNSIKPLAEMC